jgi:hypothetical protein
MFFLHQERNHRIFLANNQSATKEQVIETSRALFVVSQLVVVKKLRVTKVHNLGSPPVLGSCISKPTMILNRYHGVLGQIDQ